MTTPAPTPPGDLPGFDDIVDAGHRLLGRARVTPLATSRTLDALVGARVYLKCENFQRVGAFKFRGATNAIAQLDNSARARGVITYSSGNHGQALALAGRTAGVGVTVVMPDNAPAIKLEATRGYGATVVTYNPATQNRESVAADLVERHGYAVIPPYDHPHVIAGQGTVALELYDQLDQLDLLLVPTGGGGLLSGCALAARQRDPLCAVVGVEPELADDANRSFRSGRLETVDNPATIADGVRTPSLGRYTFPLVLDNVSDMVTVSETAIIDAVRFLFFRLKLVVEPSGALGLAAILSGAIEPRGRIGIVLSGGNVDGRTMSAILAGR